MNLLLDHALQYLARGWSVLPIHAGNAFDKNPHSPLLIATGYARRDEEDKLRGTWKPLQTQAPSEATVRQWFSGLEQERGLGIALVTGQVSGRIVVDFDGEEGRAFAEELGLRPHVRTGGGCHLHLKAPDFPVRNMVGKKTAGAPACVDIRGDGGNAVLPPTRTSKGPYVWLRDPDDLDGLDVLNPELREALGLVRPMAPTPVACTGPLPSGEDRVSAERILDWALQRLLNSAGGRNDIGNLLAWTLFNNGYSLQEVLEVGQQYVAQVGHLSSPAYTHAEFSATARSAQKAKRGEPWGMGKAAGNSRTTPRTEAEALEDIFSQLSATEQQRGAELLAHTWAMQGRPLQQTVSYLRLLGHPQAPQTVRRAYQAAEQGQAPEGTLKAFLESRRVRYG